MYRSLLQGIIETCEENLMVAGAGWHLSEIF